MLRMFVASSVVLLSCLAYFSFHNKHRPESASPSPPSGGKAGKALVQSGNRSEQRVLKPVADPEVFTESAGEMQSTVALIDAHAVEERKESGQLETSHEAALENLKAALRKSLAVIREIPAYSATLEQQIQKKGRILDPDMIDMKLRREPFSVYLKWQDDNQEVLYVEGQNQGRLLARPTRGLVSLRRIWRLHPDSSQAMKDSRYPLTEIGIEKLSAMALSFYESEKEVQQGVMCTESRSLANGKPAITYYVTFANYLVSPEYASSRLTFDEETGLMVSVESHAWDGNGNAGPLLERYRYHAFRPESKLTDEDFSELNPNYDFVR